MQNDPSTIFVKALQSIFKMKIKLWMHFWILLHQYMFSNTKSFKEEKLNLGQQLQQQQQQKNTIINKNKKYIYFLQWLKKQRNPNSLNNNNHSNNKN